MTNAKECERAGCAFQEGFKKGVDDTLSRLGHDLNCDDGLAYRLCRTLSKYFICLLVNAER